ncbi:hypothetical protein NXF25_015040 [Crotalus adamanteus]|uniref:Claudin n=1 Tax=Crotalus adamanteus TaxID=8729 RepID=A0AAW1AZC2_CROAD
MDAHAGLMSNGRSMLTELLQDFQNTGVTMETFSCFATVRKEAPLVSLFPLTIMDRYKESLFKWPIIVWFKNLKAHDWVRLGGIFFSCVATCLLMIAICTEYWVKRFIRGIFVFRGLWIDCQLGECFLLKEIPFYITVSIICMLISTIACYGAVIFGTRSLAATETSRKLSSSDLAITLSFFSGCIGGVGLFNFMRFATDEPNTFLSWSMVPGWLSIVVASMAGVCHFVAKRWEEEETAEALTTTEVFTSWGEDASKKKTQDSSIQKRK